MTEKSQPQDAIDRKTIAIIIATMACERFGNIYSTKLNAETSDAFVQWILEDQSNADVDTAALKSDAANLCRFKATAPKEWTKKKPWLNKPKAGPKLLKALVQITREASKYKLPTPPSAYAGAQGQTMPSDAVESP